MKITTRKLTAQEMIDQGVEKYTVINGGFLRSSLYVGVFILVGILISSHPTKAEKIKCSSFKYQEDAQMVYDADKENLQKLDRGGEPGKACESLPSNHENK